MSKVVCIVTYKEIIDEEKLAAYAAIAPATVQNMLVTFWRVVIGVNLNRKRSDYANNNRSSDLENAP